MIYTFPCLADCATREDLQRYSDVTLQEASAIAGGGAAEARRYAEAWLRHFSDPRNGPVTSIKGTAENVERLAAASARGAQAAIAFGPMRVIANDVGRRFIAVPSMGTDRGKHLGYLPWAEEGRLI